MKVIAEYIWLVMLKGWELHKTNFTTNLILNTIHKVIAEMKKKYKNSLYTYNKDINCKTFSFVH